MNNAELFHREMINFGGRFRVPPEGPQALAYAHFSELSEAVIRSAKTLIPTLPEIHFDFIFNEKVNAVAFESEGTYFVGVTSGTLYMLILVIFRMLSDVQLFEFIGNPAAEDKDAPLFVGYLAESQKMYNAGFRPQRPKDEKRFQYASHLVQSAYLFLIGHEIAHISLGHVDYLKSTTGRASIVELAGHESGPNSAIERQSLEMQADLRSVIAGVQSLKQRHEAFQNRSPEWSDKPSSERHLIFNWAFAMNTLFRLFRDSQFDPSQIEASPYPPLTLRRSMASVTAYAAVKDSWNPNVADQAGHSLRTAAKYSEFAFAKILGKKVSTQGLDDAFGEIGKVHHKRLLKCSADLQAKLAPFCYESLFPNLDVPQTPPNSDPDNPHQI